MLSSAERAQLTARLRRGRVDRPAGIQPRPPGVSAPLSFGQEQLWFIDRFSPGKATYNIACAVRMRGCLDVAALNRAVNGVVTRQESLRTRLVTDHDGQPHQVVDAPPEGELPVTDLSALPAGTREDRLWDAVRDDATRPFDLAAGPLFGARLMRLADDDHALVIRVHHVVFDGWSTGVLMRELIALYASEATGEPSGLATLPVQYGDYALWERNRLTGQTLERIVEYWRETLNGAATLQVPTDRARPLLESHRGAVERIDLDLALLDGLRALARQHGTTLYVVVLAAVTVLLHRYTGQDDVVVGTPTANRSREELASLIGFLVNTLPIRTDLAGDPTFIEVVRRVRDTTVAAFAHQDLPFAKLVDALRIERDFSRTPVFQVTYAHAELDDTTSTAAGLEFSVSDGGIDAGIAKFDLAFFTGASKTGFHLLGQYATDLFDAGTMRQMLDHLATLLSGAVADPARRVSELPLLSEVELYRELVEWNDTAAPLPAGCLHEQFEAQAARGPDRRAAEFGDEQLSYGQLNAAANRVGRWLAGRGVAPGVLVGVRMAPSLRRLAVLLGILKAGGGYVPLDPDLPEQRSAFMIADAGLELVLDDDGEHWAAIDSQPADDLRVAVQHSDVAYVIYTSGSTGQPKGVVVEHGQASTFVGGLLARWGIGPSDRVLQVASLSFDASVRDIFGALLSGGTAVVADRDTALSPPRLAELIRAKAITVLGISPAALSLLSGQQFPRLRVLLCGGEQMPSELQREWTRPGLRLGNSYGPTETSVTATVAELTGDISPPPIGRPMPNYRAYVLDQWLNPVPVGVVGELHIGGPGVARGYLDRPDLTGERFIDDPFHPDSRLFKTGDLVRRLPDGRLRFVGRMDGQVKIRGLRVETGEIEATLLSHPAAAQAAVTVAADRTGVPQLTGYVRADPSAGVTAAELRRHLHDWLPAYMVPARVVLVDAFPLNASGKIDKARLPDPEPATPAAEYAAPRTLTETVLVETYATLLGLDRVGIDDGFFDLGGNSLQAMQLLSRLHGDLGVDLGVSAVFLAPTPRRLAPRIEAARASRSRAGSSDVLVELSDGAGDTPLFVVHAIGGTVYGYGPLARELAGTFRVIGVEAPGLRAGSRAGGSIAELTERYGQAIRAAQGDAPYQLAGWSMGGLLAYELARWLESSGQRVGHVVLLDAPCPLGRETVPPGPSLAAQFVADAARTLGWSSGDLPDPDADQLAWLVDRLGGDTDLRADIERRFVVFEAHRRLMAGYSPAGTVAADATVIGARSSPNAAHQHRWLPRFAGSVSTAMIEADHYALLQPPRVQEVAATLIETLASRHHRGRRAR